MLRQPVEKRTQTIVEPLAGKQVAHPTKLNGELLIEAVATFFVTGIFFRCSSDNLEHLVPGRLEELNGLIRKKECNILCGGPAFGKKHGYDFLRDLTHLEWEFPIRWRRDYGWRWRCNRGHRRRGRRGRRSRRGGWRSWWGRRRHNVLFNLNVVPWLFWLDRRDDRYLLWRIVVVHNLLDGLLRLYGIQQLEEPRFSALAVVIPLCTPYAAHLPPAASENGRTKHIPVADGKLLRIRRAVALNAKYVLLVVIGVEDGHVDLVPGVADVSDDLVAVIDDKLGDD